MKVLDWGQVTPEAHDIKNNEFCYVYNHDLSSAEKVDRTIRFILGRLIYYDKHLPANPNRVVKIDIRGQQIAVATCDTIVQKLKSAYHRPDALTISFVK